MARESEILKSLQAIVASDDGAGDRPVPWAWVESGEFSGGRLKLSSLEAGTEITRLVRLGKVKILVWRGDLQLQIT
jgi:hypothetical protein